MCMSDSIAMVKDKICEQLNYKFASVRLIFKGNLLQDQMIVSDYGVQNGDQMVLVLRLS